METNHASMILAERASLYAAFPIQDDSQEEPRPNPLCSPCYSSQEPEEVLKPTHRLTIRHNILNHAMTAVATILDVPVVVACNLLRETILHPKRG